ncbi:MAG TPA: PQQ-dependent sugar dehydrogenase [Nocardioidaceae bacterium]|jgi:glucose/arabinose dehydrogenase/chitodextrinase
MRVRRLAVGGCLAVAAMTMLDLATAPPPAVAAVTPAFVQVRANEVSSGTTNSLAFTNAPKAGNLIVVYVLWNNAGAVTLSDSRGDTYASAGSRTTWGSNYSAQTFYAKNIVGGATTVTATFGTSLTSFGIVYVHEYSGVDKTNPLDVTATATGTAKAMSSGNVTTTNATDLLFGAGASSNAVNQGGTGYTTRSTASGNRTEDRVVTSTGSYAATASQNGNAWVMQIVAFKADAGGTGDTTPPSVPTGLTATAVSQTQINLAWNASSDNVGVTGYNVFRNGTLVTTVGTNSYQNSGLSPGTTYTYTVSAFDAAGNTSAPSTSASATTQSPPPDITPPTVSLTAPAAGATVSATLSVTANAADNVGVVGVQFLLDGTNLGGEDTAAPYSTSWDTTTATNGSHTLSAKARDAAGNTTTSATVSVTVSNTAPPPGGPQAAYAFDEGAGTSAADASGHGITGTLTNDASWTAGKYGTALDLDGAGDFVDLGNPTALRMTGSMTLSGWIYATAFPGDDAPIVSKRGSNGFQLDVTPDTGPRTIGFKLTNSSGGDMIRYGATALQVNSWYHVVGVYNASAVTLHVYLNGQLDDGALVGTVTNSQQNSSQDVDVGQRPSGGAFFDGRIDDVRIYNKAQSAAEIQADMLTPLGSGSSPDPTPPSVVIDAPVNGAQVSDIITVTADAEDNVGVTGVQFFVDGQPAGAEDTVAPYGLQWDTRTVSNGAHTLTAQARDAAGNTAISAGVTVNVANANFFQNEVLATGFDLPTAMKFMPDGRLLVVELAGTVLIVPPPYTQPDPTPFLHLTNVGSAGVQQGLYDIALDPNFATNHFFYVFYTLGSPNRDRLSRFTANATNTGTVAGSELVLYQDPEDANAEHHGGAIMFGNDGKLYVTTGEHFNAGESQDLTKPRGKILRLNPDGTVPTDDPFYDGSGPHWDSIWALGLRNPFRAYYDSPTGRMFVGDVGGNDASTAKEEINIGARGANYGWPDSEGPCSGQCTSPLYYYPHNGRDSAVVAGFVYHGSQFPSSYQGSFFFADYTQNWIKRLTLNPDGTLANVFNFEPADGSVDGPYGDIVYLTQGPEGALYYLDLGYSDIGGTFGLSKLRRIRYIQSDQPPIVNASANPTSGAAPLTVNFSSAGSSDPEGHALTYSWDFGDGTTSTAANPSHTYTQAGPYAARLTVSDGTNNSISPPIAINVGNKPTATITSPQDGVFFKAGDVISFSGDATDAEDGTLPASAFTWNIDFLHDGHVHPGVPQTGIKSGTFTIPTTGHDFSGTTRYRITLTVTDSSGLTDSKFVTVWPTKVNLSFDTVPSGLTLNLDGIAKTTPFVYDTLVGFNHTIQAPDQSVGSNNYTFASWSDGGAAQHVIVVPATDQAYRATYNVTSPPPTPAFVQITSTTPQSSLATVTLAYPGGQVGGDTNVIAVGWNDVSSTITSVTDSAGNTYQVATPMARGPAVSQAIYYAKNIKAAAAGTNTVTVRFSAAAPFPDIRAAEYSGLDLLNPFDKTGSASGTSATATSGSVTTASATELLFGAGMTTGVFNGSASGYTTRVITPQDGDIANDRNVTAVGSYTAGATLSGSAGWLMQIASFRAAGQ